MTNEVTKDAEESAVADDAVIEQSESTDVVADATPTEAVSEETASPEDTTQATPASEISARADSVESDIAPAISAHEAIFEETPAPALVATESTIEEAPALSAPADMIENAPAPALAAPVEASPAAEPQAVAEIDFGAILEQFEQEQTIYHSGELVEGTVVGITDRGVLVDFGYKSEGFVPVEELTGPDGEMTVNVGETIEVVIRSIHAGDSAPQLSRTDALARKVWDVVEAAFQAETPVTGRVMDKTKGGLRVDLNGLEAFLPGSQIDSRPIRGLDAYIGQDIEAKIIKFSRRRNNIVLSRKVLTDEVVNVQKAETLRRIGLGYVVEGTIKNLTEYGAFVDIGGIDGLLHVTDMSWGRIHHPGDHFKVGDHLQVKVLKLDREKEKVSLGYKQLLPDPWSTVVEVYTVDTKLKGIVSSVTEYGVFVELESGVEGLVHVSEISWSRRSQSPKRLYHRGQEVDVQVLGVDTVEKRISLGMKQFQVNPWDNVHERYPIGSKIHGRVRNLTDFGAFVELEEGIDGLVHVSDISWAKKIKHPKDVLKKDQEVDAIVTSIDKHGQRLSLSMKDLTPSAWEGFVATHRPGDVVKGKVSRFTNFGVFVELGEGLEGLCHISELSDERVDRAESVAELGQEMDFKILRIEPADQKIGLSHRAVGKENEPVADTKMYSSEAKGGMASLGELANLKFSNVAEEAPAKEDPEEKKKVKKAAKKAKADEFAAKEAEAAAEAETATEAVEAPAEEVAADEVKAESDTTEAVKAQAEEALAELETTEAVVAPAEEAVAEEAEIAVATEETAAAIEEPSDVVDEAAPAIETSEETTAPEIEIAEPVAEAEAVVVEEAAPALDATEDKSVAEIETAQAVAETEAAVVEETVVEDVAPEIETTEETPVAEIETAEPATETAETVVEETAPVAEAIVKEKTAEDAEKKSA